MPPMQQPASLYAWKKQDIQEAMLNATHLQNQKMYEIEG